MCAAQHAVHAGSQHGHPVVHLYLLLTALRVHQSSAVHMYFVVQGRSLGTQAYTHALETQHHMFMKLDNGKVRTPCFAQHRAQSPTMLLSSENWLHVFGWRPGGIVTQPIGVARSMGRALGSCQCACRLTMCLQTDTRGTHNCWACRLIHQDDCGPM